MHAYMFNRHLDFSNLPAKLKVALQGKIRLGWIEEEFNTVQYTYFHGYNSQLYQTNETII